MMLFTLCALLNVPLFLNIFFTVEHETGKALKWKPWVWRLVAACDWYSVLFPLILLLGYSRSPLVGGVLGTISLVLSLGLRWRTLHPGDPERADGVGLFYVSGRMLSNHVIAVFVIPWTHLFVSR